MSTLGPKSYPVVYDTDNGFQYSFESGYIAIPAPHVTPPAGLDTQIQYNNAGAFGASSNFTWNNSASILNLISSTNVPQLQFYSDFGAQIVASNFAESIDFATIQMNPNGTVVILPSAQGSGYTFADPGGLTFPGQTTEPGSPVEGMQIYNSTSHQMEVYNGTTWVSFGASPIAVLSAATVGGAAAEEVAVAGLLTTSTILAVTQQVAGGAALPLTGWTNVINGELNVTYSADMGPGARVLVYFIP
jgi:hypothetical protein